MRRLAIPAVLGFVIGAALHARGQDDGVDPELVDRLEALQVAAARVLQRHPSAGEFPAEGGLHHEILDLGDLVMGAPDFAPPARRLLPDEAESGGPFVHEDSPDSGPLGTIEELAELVQTSVWPETWQAGGRIHLFTSRHASVRQGRAVHQDLRTFLDGLRRDAHRCVTVEAELVDVPRELAARLQEGAGTALDGARRHALDQALAAGEARRVVALRGTGIAGRQLVVWHGRQVAALAGYDVELATNVAGTAPRVRVVDAGGSLAARPRLGRAGDPIRLEIRFRFDALDLPMETAATEHGPVDRPRVAAFAGRVSLLVPERGWAVAASGDGPAGSRRLLLVRPTTLERKGAAR